MPKLASSILSAPGGLVWWRANRRCPRNRIRSSALSNSPRSATQPIFLSYVMLDSSKILHRQAGFGQFSTARRRSTSFKTNGRRVPTPDRKRLPFLFWFSRRDVSSRGRLGHRRRRGRSRWCRPWRRGGRPRCRRGRRHDGRRRRDRSHHDPRHIPFHAFFCFFPIVRRSRRVSRRFSTARSAVSVLTFDFACGLSPNSRSVALFAPNSDRK
jgi:hypothetical protein